MKGKRGKMSLEQYSKATRETAENLRIIDDALFRLMAEREGVCQEILRTLLDMPNLDVVNVNSQSVVKSLHREVTLDALCILENGEYVNIEMQKGACNDDIARTRFHAASLTSAYTPKGVQTPNQNDNNICFFFIILSYCNNMTTGRSSGLRTFRTYRIFCPSNDFIQ